MFSPSRGGALAQLMGHFGFLTQPPTNVDHTMPIKSWKLVSEVEQIKYSYTKVLPS